MENEIRENEVIENTNKKKGMRGESGVRIEGREIRNEERMKELNRKTKIKSKIMEETKTKRKKNMKGGKH